MSLSNKAESILTELVEAPKRVLADLSLKISRKESQGKEHAFDSIKKDELEIIIAKALNSSVPELRRRGEGFILDQAQNLTESADNVERIAHKRAMNTFMKMRV